MNEHMLADSNRAASGVEQVTATAAGSAPARSRWQRIKLILKVLEVRLRFVGILIVVALFVGYWDVIRNHWDKATRADGMAFRSVRAVLGDKTARRWWPQPAGPSAAGADNEYFCPMHPSVVRQELDANGAMPKCPICGMPLSPRKKAVQAALPDGVLSRKQFSPEQIQLAGVRTEPVAYRPLVRELETVGHVAYDETLRSRIVSRVSGYLEKLVVDQPWITVATGEPLAEIDSPELYSGARELLLATERGSSGELAKSARERLRLFGISDSEIDELVTERRANHRLVIRSPRAGHVIRKDVVEGAHVAAGATLFEIADLSRVWIEADVFQADVGWLRAGQSVEARVEGRSEVVRGEVSLVHPHLDAATRTNAVRFEVDNPEHKLRPGMFATVRIQVPIGELNLSATRPSDGGDPANGAGQGEVLAIPERAVVDTGSLRVVYAERAPGEFEGVAVELGPRAGGYYPVLRGLEPGDRVATNGSFLIDAETRLNPAAAGTYMGAGGGPSAGRTASPAGGASGTSQPKRPSADDLKNIHKLSPDDRRHAIQQKICPVSGQPLGSMGVPTKVMLGDRAVFICCEGCEAELRRDADKFLEQQGTPGEEGR